MHALEGFQGTAGYMPPKGGRVDLSDDEIRAAVDYLLEQSR
jgi:cytochrome c